MFSGERERQEREKRIIEKRVVMSIVLVALIFMCFVGRLFYWQIVQGSYYKNLAEKSTAYTVTTDATRGEILDCNGKGLAVNKSSYRVEIDKLYFEEKNKITSILTLIDLVEKSQEKWIDVLPVSVNGEKFVFTNDKKEIEVLKSENYLDLEEKDTAEKCMEKLIEEYELGKIKDKKKQRNLASVFYNMDKQGFSNTNPYIFAEDISAEAVAIISENTQSMAGIEIDTYLERYAPQGNLMPHILGALGSITQEEYDEKTKEGKVYALNDEIGKFGMENAYEDKLKGKPGEKIVQKNAQGSITNVVQTVDAKPGETVYLTIDSKLQKVANTSLEKNIKDAKNNGILYENGNGADCNSGAVVMLDVKDFSVLASSSYPTYDLNEYSKYDDYYISLTENEYSPMFNRAFVGSFAPGSVYKPIIAVAALEEGIITSETEINCTQTYDFYPKNPVSCMGHHSFINLNSAMTRSCNYFFAEVGRLLGIDRAYLYAEKFGLGEKTGLEIAEDDGFLAGRDSSVWVDGNTVQAAIGQSDNSFTPVQLATYTATIANDGVRLKTHLVQEIRNYQRTKVTYKYDSDNPKVIEKVGVSKKNLELVQKSMRSVVTGEKGTANGIFGNYPIEVAAKTGTAENSGSDHGVFICYAPYDEPQVAVAVVLEHGAYTKYSMNVAKDLLNSYFGIKTEKINQ